MTTDIPRIDSILSYVIADKQFLRTKETRTITFSKSLASSSFRERNGIGAEVAEEYSWAITQAARKLCCIRSCSSMWEFGFQMVSYVYTSEHIVFPLYVQLQTAQNSNYTEPSGTYVLSVAKFP